MAPSLASKFKLGRPAPLKVQSPAGKSGKEPLASLDDNAGTGTSPQHCMWGQTTVAFAKMPTPPDQLRSPGAADKAPAAATEEEVWHKPAAGRRRTTLDKPGAAPELNAYMKGKVPKGEVRLWGSCCAFPPPCHPGSLQHPKAPSQLSYRHALCGSSLGGTAPLSLTYGILKQPTSGRSTSQCSPPAAWCAPTGGAPLPGLLSCRWKTGQRARLLTEHAAKAACMVSTVSCLGARSQARTLSWRGQWGSCAARVRRGIASCWAQCCRAWRRWRASPPPWSPSCCSSRAPATTGGPLPVSCACLCTSLRSLCRVFHQRYM